MPTVLSMRRGPTALRQAADTTPTARSQGRQTRILDDFTCAIPSQTLPQRNWSPGNHAQLGQWLAAAAQAPATGDLRVAAFDWDGTSIIGDSGVFCWHYMVDHFLIRVPPGRLDEVLPWPDSTRYPASEADFIARLRLDIAQAYRVLWSLRASAQAVQDAPERLDFRAKLGVYCAHYDKVTPPTTTEGPLWMKWFTGFVPEELGALAVRAVACAEDTALVTRRWTSQATGLAGRVDYIYRAGLVRRAEMFDLMHALDACGIAVCVITGGIEPMIRALVRHMGAPVSRHHVIGIRYHRDEDGCLLPNFLPDSHRPISYGPGKSSCIRKFLPAAPILVAGDTAGDLDMLQAFAQTQIRLIVANALRGPLLALAQDPNAPATLVQAVHAAHGGFVQQPVNLAQASVQAAGLGAAEALLQPCTETAASAARARCETPDAPSSFATSA